MKRPVRNLQLQNNSEEYDRMADLVKSLTHLSPPDYFSQIALERFSPYFKRPHEFGLKIIGPRRFYRFLYHCDEKTLSDLAYNFDYAHEDGRDPNCYVTELKERTEYWQKDLYLSLAVPMNPRLKGASLEAPIEREARFVELTRQLLKRLRRLNFAFRACSFQSAVQVRTLIAWRL